MIDYDYKNAQTFDEGVHNLYEIVTMLRSPQGCPWDREQSPSDISRALLDETYEYIDALRKQDQVACAEEIGDVLLNAFMIIRMHEEHDDFQPVEALNAICEKLVRRHPHVFAHVQAKDSGQVLDIWNKVKEDVEGRIADKDDFFSRVPKSLPQLEEAWEIQKKMRKVGFDWPDIAGVLDKVDEERAELVEAIEHIQEDPDHVEEELGDLLFAIVNVGRYLKISPSIALHRCNMKVKDRFNKLASICANRGIELDRRNVDALNLVWEEIKQEERHA